jgi:hypothetical protein
MGFHGSGHSLLAISYSLLQANLFFHPRPPPPQGEAKRGDATLLVGDIFFDPEGYDDQGVTSSE